MKNKINKIFKSFISFFFGANTTSNYLHKYDHKSVHFYFKSAHRNRSFEKVLRFYLNYSIENHYGK